MSDVNASYAIRGQFLELIAPSSVRSQSQQTAFRRLLRHTSSLLHDKSSTARGSAVVAYDPELKLLWDIADEIGEYVPWEQSSPRGENWMWEQKIHYFKHCLEHVLLKPFPDEGVNGSFCPRTWDGWNCWDDTPAGRTAFAPCPQFVAGFISSRQAHKVCTPNATWFRHPITGIIWSNYTACVDTHDLQFRNLVNSLYVTGYSISLVALLISIFIFCYFRSLRCRRITIHKNLFTSFIINNLCWILWYINVIAQPHVIEENPKWCQVLHVVTQYFLLCNYLWMFCEGLYLHTLLVLAFIAEDNIIKWFLLIGWGFPLIPAIGYGVTRGLDNEASRMCWVEHDVWYTYILSVPVCISILLSFAFLVNIVRVLVTKLRAVNSPDNESTRKAVRATVILLPLLGLHYVVTPFRPDKGSIFLAYEIISALVTSLQLSFAFLVNIVRVLVTKLRAVNSPDNESTRKAVRATVILLPLLGLHYVVTPFRPDKGSIFLAYEIISALVTSLQGLCVALLFCFFNGENKLSLSCPTRNLLLVSFSLKLDVADILLRREDDPYVSSMACGTGG
ncbi:hypothetical protein HPB50_007135 [Hyalomma asiaticum]|uniref:Uncharacterized protein n=1 Tax=Hyalomma asiaticum TaxID=266040 RepID=A0ACB7STF5_HYAAI|nr:hypothetical protein HPB50_007135 [Hyalomma asiaticum]